MNKLLRTLNTYITIDVLKIFENVGVLLVQLIAGSKYTPYKKRGIFFDLYKICG